MTFRIGWLSPLTPTSGVGTFSASILRDFPSSFEGEEIDVTVLYVAHGRLYRTRHRSIEIGDGEDFHQILTIFDLLIYNIGNNREHHEPIFKLLRLCPGIVICHDFVYQHYLADVSFKRSSSFSPFAALLLKHGDATASDFIKRSRITSRTGEVRYSPWDTEISVAQPMSEALLALGSALVVHSRFAQQHAEASFHGPVLRIGMPHDQKPSKRMNVESWRRSLATKTAFKIVSFGHIQPTKCIDLVLAALAESASLRQRVRYTIAGFALNPGYLEQLKTLVVSARLESIVSFELDLSDRRLDELMEEADIFLNLRRPNTEGSSVSLIEQLDTGRPVILIDSGSYAEVPADAAVKVPPAATYEDIRLALEALTAEPKLMISLGEAGRAYARARTCASYAADLLRFAFDNRALLKKRADVRGNNPMAHQYSGDDAWVRELARARTSLHYLHANILPIDPSLLIGKSTAELCDYAATVIFGMFKDAQLKRALARFFARLDDRASYWACVRFALIVEATFGEDNGARARLLSMKPCYDPEFWAVIECFPPRPHLAAAMLILARRYPTSEEFTATSLDDHDGFPKRLRARGLVKELTGNKDRDSRLERLERWLDESCAPALNFALPLIEHDIEYEVGSADFRAQADLSGFYAMEPDHAWTRGTHGFVGLWLKAGTARVDVLVNHIGASAERPCSIMISHDTAHEELKVTDGTPQWMSLDVTASDDMVWIKFATDVAMRPPNSSDTRLLGICFRMLRVKVKAPEQEKPRASIGVLRELARAAGVTGRTHALPEFESKRLQSRG